MTSNRPLAGPDAYPAAFHSAVANGGAVLYAADLPWSPIMSAKRFRQFLALLRKAGNPNAKARWRVEPTGLALVLTMNRPATPATYPHAALIEAALQRAQDNE